MNEWEKAIGALGGYSQGSLSGMTHRQAIQMPASDWARMVDAQMGTTTGNAIRFQAESPKPVKPPSSNIEWLDRRVNEIRAKL